MTEISPPEAPLVQTEAGLRPGGEGWFVVNLSEAGAIASEDAGSAWTFEDPAHRFPHFGINIHVLQPGEPASKYHAEEAQEAVLVLQGEGLLVVGDEERRLRQWDFFHAAPWTPHVLVGAGSGPCAVLMVGARFAGKGIVYPVSEVAARYGASVEAETSSPREAYAGWRPPAPARKPWPPA
ncbi:MAG TPA: cupin domain-containing protein [Thermoleophilaceae bacterium]|nr:cupin domain-containing protein [Thermoleophilaceae bacterium]